MQKTLHSGADARRSVHGVTLIELMIVVAILAITAMFAVPAYRQYVQRAQRADATATLMRIASEQEQFFMQNNTYTVNLGAPPAGIGIAVTEKGYYGLNVPVANVTTFTATATALAGQGQFADTACRTFTITAQGARTAQDSGGADNTAVCWR